MDSGQPFRIRNGPNNASGLVVSGGKMVHGAPTGTNCAGYLEATLDNKITRIGASFSYPDVTNGGSVALVSFASSIVKETVDLGHPIPDAGLHVTLTPTNISVIIYSGSGSTNLGNIPITPLQANTTYNFEVVVDNDNSTLYVIKPDGTLSQVFTDSRIASLRSNYATFELYEYNKTKTPASIISVWADDEDTQKK